MHVMADIRGNPQQILELLIEQNPHADQRELAFAFHEQVREDVSLRETLVNDVHNLLRLIVEKKKWGLWLYDGEEAICKLLDNKLEWEKEAADYGQQARGDRRNEVSQKTRIGELIEKVLAELCEDKRPTKADWDAVAEWLKRVGYLYVPQISIAVDVYFPRAHLIDCLRTLQTDVPTAAINLRMTTMQGGDGLVLEGTCALAVTIANVPELSPSAIERHWLRETQIVTVCAPTHPLATSSEPISLEEFGRHIQLVVTDNQPVAGERQWLLNDLSAKRQWLLNDLSAKHDFLRAGLGWGHMPEHLVADDLANGKLVELKRRAWHIRPLTFMISRRRAYDFSACEVRLIELLANAGAPYGKPMPPKWGR
jgi:DNA-binding transcriptional LysR family regulator